MPDNPPENWQVKYWKSVGIIAQIQRIIDLFFLPDSSIFGYRFSIEQVQGICYHEDTWGGMRSTEYIKVSFLSSSKNTHDEGDTVKEENIDDVKKSKTGKKN